MDDSLIRRSDAIKALYKYNFVSKNVIEREINAIPSADRPTGKWIHGSYIGGPDYRRCNQCFAEIEEIFFGFEYDVNYCPNCGAKMLGEDGEA